jgi:O-antigen/teichoic acid export membrane protein
VARSLKDYINKLLVDAKVKQAQIATMKLSGFAAYAAAGIFSSFPPLVLMPTLTGNLSPEDFAKTVLVWSALALLTPLFGFGAVNSASVRFFKLSKEEFANHLMSIVSLISISAVILIVVGAFVNFQIYSFLPVKIVEFIIILTIAYLMGLGQLFGSLAIATSRAFFYLKIYILYGVVTVVIVNFFILILGMKIGGFLLGVLIGAVCLAIAAFLGNSYYTTGGTATLRDSKSALSYGFPLMFHSVGINLSSTSDRFIIAGTIGLSQLALYSVTAQVALLANFAANAIVKCMQPRLFGFLRAPDITTNKSIQRLAMLYIATTLFLSILVGLFTPTIVELIAGSMYRIDWTSTFFLVTGGVFGSWYLFFSLFLHFYERTFHILLITIISAAVQVILCYHLVSSYGIVGASIAYAASNCIMFLFTLFIASISIRKHLKAFG